MRFPGSPAQVTELKKAFHQGGAKGFLRMMVSQKANEGADAIEVAALYSLLGETDQAFAWLGKAYQRRSPLMEFLMEDPDFDHLRSDPGSANSSAVPAWRIDRVPESRGQFLGGSAMSPVASVVGPRGDRGPSAAYSR